MKKHPDFHNNKISTTPLTWIVGDDGEVVPMVCPHHDDNNKNNNHHQEDAPLVDMALVSPSEETEPSIHKQDHSSPPRISIHHHPPHCNNNKYDNDETIDNNNNNIPNTSRFLASSSPLSPLVMMTGDTNRSPTTTTLTTSTPTSPMMMMDSHHVVSHTTPPPPTTTPVHASMMDPLLMMGIQSRRSYHATALLEHLTNHSTTIARHRSNSGGTLNGSFSRNSMMNGRYGGHEDDEDSFHLEMMRRRQKKETLLTTDKEKNIPNLSAQSWPPLKKSNGNNVLSMGRWKRFWNAFWSFLIALFYFIIHFRSRMKIYGPLMWNFIVNVTKRIWMNFKNFGIAFLKIVIGMVIFTVKKPKTVLKYATFVSLIYVTFVVTRNLCERAKEEISRVDTGLSFIPSPHLPHIFLIWEGNSVTLNQFRAIETILHTNPNAEVLIFSNELDLDTFKIYTTLPSSKNQQATTSKLSENDEKSTHLKQKHLKNSSQKRSIQVNPPMTHKKNRKLTSSVVNSQKSTNSFLKQMLKEKKRYNIRVVRFNLQEMTQGSQLGHVFANTLRNFNPRIHPFQSLSNFLRLFLLYHYGGLYIENGHYLMRSMHSLHNNTIGVTLQPSTTATSIISSSTFSCNYHSTFSIGKLQNVSCMSNQFMYFEKGHPFLKHALQNLDRSHASIESGQYVAGPPGLFPLIQFYFRKLFFVDTRKLHCHRYDPSTFSVTNVSPMSEQLFDAAQLCYSIDVNSEMMKTKSNEEFDREWRSHSFLERAYTHTLFMRGIMGESFDEIARLGEDSGLIEMLKTLEKGDELLNFINGGHNLDH